MKIEDFKEMPKKMNGVSGAYKPIKVTETSAKTKIPFAKYFRMKPESIVIEADRIIFNFKMGDKAASVTIEGTIEQLNEVGERGQKIFVEMLETEGPLRKFVDHIGLKGLRKQAGLTQRELAEKTKINLRTLQYYEQGRLDIKKAKWETVEKLSDFFGVHYKVL